MTCISFGRIVAALIASLTVATACAQTRVRVPRTGVAFSADSSLVAFVRPTPGIRVAAGAMGAVDDSVDATEIWIARRDGSAARRLLRGRANTDMRFVLADMSSLAFSADGTRIFFLSRAWVVSNAVHVVDVATSRDRYVTAGNEFRVILRGEYAGCLIVAQHRYYPLGGSYDFHWLTSQSGKDLGLVSDADWNRLAANRFAALGMSSDDSTATGANPQC